MSQDEMTEEQKKEYDAFLAKKAAEPSFISQVWDGAYSAGGVLMFGAGMVTFWLLSKALGDGWSIEYSSEETIVEYYEYHE